MIEQTIQNEVFQLYIILIGGLLFATGLIFLVLDKGFGKNLSSQWNTYRGWLMMAPLFLICTILGRVALIIAILGLSILGFTEFSRAMKLNQNRWITNLVYLGITAVAILAIVRNPPTGQFGAYGVFMALPAYVVGLIMLVPIVQNLYEGQLQAVALGIMGFIYFGWMFGHLSFLADSQYAINYVLYLVCAVQINDVAAYTFGKMFGGRKLRSNISPNKTVAGSLGALTVSMILPWLFASTFPKFDSLQLILTGLIIGIGGQLGDLTISFIKRDVGIKDMGTFIPGHGGILDRIDSLIYVSPLFFHMARFFDGLYA